MAQSSPEAGEPGVVKAPRAQSAHAHWAAPFIPPGVVEVAQYGQVEEDLAYRDRGFLAVRFDPPFAVPYRIKAIRFPSFTTNGAPAVFPSIRLCAPGGPVGFPQINQPLFQIAPFVGSENGVNEVPFDHAVSDSGEIFYVCVEFPSIASPGFPDGYPFMRMDYLDLERGLFGNSFSVLPNGAAINLNDRNLAISLLCELPSPEHVPIESGSNLGANRLLSNIEFTFRPPGDVAADGSPLRRNSLLQTLLLYRTLFGAWTVVDSAGRGESSILLESLPPNAMQWATQAVDKNGNRSILSSGPYTRGVSNLLGDGLTYDFDEPNGSTDCARPIVSEHRSRLGSCEPAGDQDYFSFSAVPGDTVDIIAAATKNGKNDLDLVISLYDQAGKLVGFDDNSNGGLIDPRLVYVIPWRSKTHRDPAPRLYTMLIRERRGSFLDPESAPRSAGFAKGWYNWSYQVYRGREPSPARSAPWEVSAERLDVMTVGALGRTVTIRYSIPMTVEAPRVSLRIFDVHGRMVRVLVDDEIMAGKHEILWDGRGQSGRRAGAGVYFVELVFGTAHVVSKVTLGS